MGIKSWVQNMFAVKQVHVDPSSNTEYSINKSLQYQSAELKATLDKVLLENAKLKGTQNQQEKEEEIKLQLNQKKQQLEAVRTTNYFSLGSFFSNYLKDRRFAENLFFTDFQRAKKLDKFLDFGITEYGEFVAVGQNGVLLKFEELKNFFASLPALNNDVERGIIPLCLDDTGVWMENPVIVDVPEVKRAEDGRLRFFKSRKKPFYEAIADKNTLIAQINSELVQKEEYILELESQVDEMQRANRLNEATNHIKSAQLSKIEKADTEIARAFDNIVRRTENERNKNLILEDNMEELAQNLEVIRTKITDKESQLPVEQALEQVKNIRRELVRDEPRTKIVEQVVQAKPTPLEVS